MKVGVKSKKQMLYCLYNNIPIVFSIGNKTKAKMYVNNEMVTLYVDIDPSESKTSASKKTLLNKKDSNPFVAKKKGEVSI